MKSNKAITTATTFIASNLVAGMIALLLAPRSPDPGIAYIIGSLSSALGPFVVFLVLIPFGEIPAYILTISSILTIVLLVLWIKSEYWSIKRNLIVCGAWSLFGCVFTIILLNIVCC